MGVERVYIEKVMDGDTYNGSNGRIFRLIGVDCPDFRLPYFDESFEFVKDAIEGREVLAEFCNVRKLDTYNRERVIIYYKDKRGQNHNLNTKLLKLGYARLFTVTPCHIDFFEWAKIEAGARNKKIGLWSTEKDDIITNNFTLNFEDDRELGFTKISNKFFKLGYFWSLSDASKIIYMLLCNMAHPSGIVWAAFTTITKRTRYDINTVLMALNELSAAGLIFYRISQSKDKPNYIVLQKIIPQIKNDASVDEKQIETLSLF
ncbi:MAG: thermonuclease family protein [Candidatus Wallbacteria bacterium]